MTVASTGRTDYPSFLRDSLVQFVRPVFIAFLCTVAALGNAPAWVYRATCDECSTKVGSVAQASCGHCCHYQHEEAEILTQRREHQEAPQDSDSCAICQSLACPVGVGWEHVPPPQSDTVAGRLTAFSATIDYELWMAAAHPRGPPRST